MNEHANVVNVARHHPAGGRRDEVAGMLRVLAEDARKAPGCFGAQITSSDRDRDGLVLISRWESAEAMRKFQQQDEYTGFEREIGESLSRPLDSETFTTA
ncbi:MAG TPA: antibiotic biosynthesis monooxygenase family protein [Candidatus Udaeobacter sp.]|nr:antibiotic biosynthesis monooxygenase family protein [Candidatus Udaeobacter sp.]